MKALFTSAVAALMLPSLMWSIARSNVTRPYQSSFVVVAESDVLGFLRNSDALIVVCPPIRKIRLHGSPLCLFCQFTTTGEIIALSPVQNCRCALLTPPCPSRNHASRHDRVATIECAW